MHLLLGTRELASIGSKPAWSFNKPLGITLLPLLLNYHFCLYSGTVILTLQGQFKWTIAKKKKGTPESLHGPIDYFFLDRSSRQRKNLDLQPGLRSIRHSSAEIKPF